MKAREAFDNGDYGAAINILQAAKNFNHSDKNIIHLLALSYAANGDNYNAMMWFKSALSLDYNFLEARNNYGVFLKRTGQVKQAKKEFEVCIQINPNYAEPHYHRGEILHEQGDLDGAIEEFRTAVYLKENYFEAQRDLGISIYEKYEKGELKDISESLDKLQNAAKLIPKNPMVHYYLGRIWCAQGNLDEAEKEFRISLMCDANFAAGHFELGKLRYLRGDPIRCLIEMSAALKVNPTYTESKSYPKLDRLDVKRWTAPANEVKNFVNNAIRDWTEVAQETRNNTELINHIKALMKERDKNNKGGRRKKNEPVFDVDQHNALLEKGVEEVDEGNLTQAKATFNRALEVNPNSWEAYQNLGGILEQEGDVNSASDRYQKAIAIVPLYDGLYYNMGYLLEKMRLPIEAGRMYRKYRDMHGKYPYDPKHIVNLQLQDVQQQQRQKSGY